MDLCERRKHKGRGNEREREREKGDVLECGVEGYLAEKLPEQSREHSPWIFLSSDVSDEDFKVFEYLGQHKDD